MIKTVHVHQYIGQFLTDCLQTFTKECLIFLRWLQWGVTSLCFEQNYIFLFKSVILSQFLTDCLQNCTFYSNPSYTSQSILNALPSNLHKLGLIFRDDRNKGSQLYVSSKTTHFIQTRHMHLCQFLTDCLSNLHKEGLIFPDDQNKGSQPYNFKQNCTFSAISLSILKGLFSKLHKVGLIFRDNRNKG